jgi:enediyne biosynthesis protein E4
MARWAVGLIGLLCLTWPVGAAKAQAQVDIEPLATSVCTGAFVAHDLPHITEVNAQPIRTYDSNGAGLAINDLNGDGRLDIVLANLDGPITLLWNEGGGAFRTQSLDIPGRVRGVVAVDVEGDGDLDLTLTTQLGAPIMLRNEGNETFELAILPGVERPAYTLDWADADDDGDLDLATGSYDTDLEKTLRDTFLFGPGAGVFYYEQVGGKFAPLRLAETAQALTVMFTDLDLDGQRELAVGNDFSAPDQFWERGADGGWLAIAPFAQLTHSTMSFDVADIRNDGTVVLFAADMKPYAGENQAGWTPVLQQLARTGDQPDDNQVPENTLQVNTDNAFANRARLTNAFATGWSWSSKFGDLDSDGWLDLYVVNGMIAADLFGHLPGGELVEENQALRSLEGRLFMPAPEWGLNSTRSGRGMSMADLDGDGDLDIVVNNLASAAQWFENQVCGGDNLIVRLRDSTTANHFGLGVQVRVTADGLTRTRTIRASSGYLSGDPAEAHFGIPFGAESVSVEVIWPDGTRTTAEALPQSLLTLSR